MTEAKALHIFYVTLIALGLLAGHEWLSEHDARLKADATVLASEQREQTIEAQLKALQATTEKQQAAVAEKVSAIKTTPQAIAAIPTLSDIPLNARPVPSMPDAVAVAAIPLAQELGECVSNRIGLVSCKQTLELESGLRVECKTQLAAVTAKPKLAHRLWSQIKSGSLFLSIGIIAAKLLH